MLVSYSCTCRNPTHLLSPQGRAVQCTGLGSRDGVGPRAKGPRWGMGWAWGEQQAWCRLATRMGRMGTGCPDVSAHHIQVLVGSIE